MSAIPIRPPIVIRGQPLPGIDILRMVDRVVEHHFDEDGNFHGEEGELSTDCYPICACEGPVPAHVDNMEGHHLGKLIYGLVLRSEGHVLRTVSQIDAGLNGILLQPGDLYELHPLDRHWTHTDTPGGKLVFAAAFISQDDDRFGQLEKIAHDLRWEVMAQAMEWCARKDREVLDLAAQARERYRIS